LLQVIQQIILFTVFGRWNRIDSLDVPSIFQGNFMKLLE